ncbi:MAG: patatin family protein, partial [Methanocorpusculum sp.]|nr:patatin family protein [Methanocorpusculum sp.]
FSEGECIQSFIPACPMIMHMYSAAAIFEGGGMRGEYATGAIDAFLDNDIEFSSVYGVSAGACHATSLISKQRGRAFRISSNYLHDKTYCSVYSLITTGGLFGVDMLFNRLHNELDLFDYDTYDAYSGKFYVVVTNLQTGKAEYKTLTTDEMRHGMHAIQASSSMPLVSKVVHMGEFDYLDGCIGDSIPLERSIEEGNQKNILILTREAGYRKGSNKLMPLIKMKYREYPNFVARCADRHIRYNATLDLIAAEEKAGRAFVIRPKQALNVGVVTKSKEKLKGLYDQGYADTDARMDELLAYLKST